MIDANRPASRILAMLELLQDRPGMSGPALADALGVTTRTIRRYVVTLQEMGIPVEPAAGRIGGYWLRPGFRMPPLMFSADEAIGLAVALLTTRVAHYQELPAPVSGALAKIERTLPTELAARIQVIRDGFQVAAYPGPDGSAFPQPEILALIIQASLSHNRCWIRYGSSMGQHTSRDIDPYGVLFVDGRWYVHGWCHLRKDARTFRIDRVRRVDILPDSFETPEGFDLQRAVLRSITMSRGGEFEVIVSAPAEDVRQRVPFSMAEVEPIDASSCRVVGTTDNPGWMVTRLAEMPFAMQLVGSRSLRDTMVRMGNRLLQAAGEETATEQGGEARTPVAARQ